MKCVWRLATACASKRAAAATMRRGLSEALSSRRMSTGTRMAGGIDAGEWLELNRLDHVRRPSCTDISQASFSTGSRHSLQVRTTMSKPSLELSYQRTEDWPCVSSYVSDSLPNPLRVAVLDSSFNPPSRAHYAMATFAPADFHAHLLLLSSKNVDKVAQPGDAAFSDRMEMIELMANTMQAKAPQDFSVVAVGSLAAATFAEKAPIIQDYLHTVPATPPGQEYALCFFIGYDTVTRLFMPKYYSDSEETMNSTLEKFFIQDGCQVVCARRPVENVAQKDVADQDEKAFLARKDVAKWLENGKLQVVDIPGTDGVSSTKIREAFKKLSEGDSEEADTTLKQMVLEDVLAHCKEKGLYKQ